MQQCACGVAALRVMIDPMRLMTHLGMAAMIGFAAAMILEFGTPAARAESQFGPQSAEHQPDRQQQWLVPSPDPATASHAIVYRPQGEGPFPLAVVAHASTQNALRRAQMPQPDYQGLAQQLVARGFAVLVPERPGHGVTGGPYLEDQGGCDDADDGKAGRATAASISKAMAFMQTQPFIKMNGAVVIGHSAGAWGALALASADPNVVRRIIAFAPGRGGHAGDRPFAVCAETKLVAAAGEFGKGARVPVTWLVARNDSYFSPALSQRMADAFSASGGQVDFRVLPPSGDEGHWLAERGDGRDLASWLQVDLNPVAAGTQRRRR
jgi:dienelactone hydrolase